MTKLTAGGWHERWRSISETTPEFWMNLQTNYDLEVALDVVGPEITGRIVPHRAA